MNRLPDCCSLTHRCPEQAEFGGWLRANDARTIFETRRRCITSVPGDWVERVPARSAIPCPHVSARVTDLETGKELPQHTIGMIEASSAGPNVFKGYWRMPEKTKAEFRDDGFFITGDLGKIDDRGYVHILGRGKDLVILGGFNVYPKEIESEIDAMLAWSNPP